MPRPTTTCEAPGCGAKNYARAGKHARLCKKHGAQVNRHGRLTPERERGVKLVCVADGCTRTDTFGRPPHCRKHACQIRTHGRLTPEREHQMGNEKCRTPGCKNKHRAKGYCVTHYGQRRWLAIKGKLEQLKAIEAAQG